MSEYSKKLHIRKNGTIEDIVLYTDTSGLSGGALALRDGSNIVYAALGSTTDSAASRLRVRKSGIIYAALKSGYPAGSKSAYFGTGSTKINFSLPSGTKRIQVDLVFTKGGNVTQYFSVSKTDVELIGYSLYNQYTGYSGCITLKVGGESLINNKGYLNCVGVNVLWSSKINNG